MAVDVLADVVTDAVLEPAHVELERNVVLEEIAIRDDDPEDLLGELFDDAMFGDHPLGRPIVGSEESVRGDGPRRAARVLARPLHDAADGRRRGGQPAPRARRGARRRRPGRRGGPGRPRRRARAAARRGPAPADGHPAGAAERRQRAGAPHDRRARRRPGTTRAAPRCPCSAPRSAAGPARGCSSRSASSAGWRTRCTPRRRATRTPAPSPSTPGAAPSGSARSRPWCAACSADVAANGLTEAELVRARGIAARRPGARQRGHPVADEPHRPLRGRPRPPAHDRARAWTGSPRSPASRSRSWPASCWRSRSVDGGGGPVRRRGRPARAGPRLTRAAPALERARSSAHRASGTAVTAGTRVVCRPRPAAATPRRRTVTHAPDRQRRRHARRRAAGRRRARRRGRPGAARAGPGRRRHRGCGPCRATTPSAGRSSASRSPLVVAGAVLKYLLPGRRMRDAGVPGRTLVARRGAGHRRVLRRPGRRAAPRVRARGVPRRAGPASGGPRAWPSARHALTAVGWSILIELAAGLLATAVWVGALVLA